MKEGAGDAKNHIFCSFENPVHRSKGFLIVIFPDILTVNQARKQKFILREAVCFQQIKGTPPFHKIQSDSIKGEGCKPLVAVPHISVIGLQQNLQTVFLS